jgi:hypothetical protein
MDIVSMVASFMALLSNPMFTTPIPAYFALGPLGILFIILLTLLGRKPQVVVAPSVAAVVAEQSPLEMSSNGMRQAQTPFLKTAPPAPLVDTIQPIQTVSEMLAAQAPAEPVVTQSQVPVVQAPVAPLEAQEQAPVTASAPVVEQVVPLTTPVAPMTTETTPLEQVAPTPVVVEVPVAPATPVVPSTASP